MKKIHIVLIILVAVVSGILVMTYTSAVDQGTFSEAALNPDRQIKITGTFDKSKPVEYDALADADLTTFYVIDREGRSTRVLLRDKSGKPMGLDQSESVTIEGKIAPDGSFHATTLLMKCPSKYNEQKHMLSEDSAQ